MILKFVNLKYHGWTLIGEWAAIKIRTEYKFTTYLTDSGVVVSLFDVIFLLEN